MTVRGNNNPEAFASPQKCEPLIVGKSMPLNKSTSKRKVNGKDSQSGKGQGYGENYYLDGQVLYH